MECITSNPGLKYIAENIFIRLDQESLFACRIVASAWKNILNNPMFLLKKLGHDPNESNEIHILSESIKFQNFNIKAYTDDGHRLNSEMCLPRLNFGRQIRTIPRLQRASTAPATISQHTDNPSPIKMKHFLMVWKKLALKIEKEVLKDKLTLCLMKMLKAGAGLKSPVQITAELRMSEEKISKKQDEIKSVVDLVKFILQNIECDCSVCVGHSVGKSKKYSAPIHLAADNGFFNVVKKLMKKNPENVKATNVDGWTPIHFAANNGHYKIVKLLISYSFNPNAPSIVGTTPIHLASIGGHLEIIKLLLTYTNSANEQDYFGVTPIHLAAENGHLEIIKCLVPCSKSPIIVEDNYGETPITRAEKHQDVIEYLLQFSKENENNDNPNGSPSSTMEVSKSSDDEISTEVVDDKDKHIPLQILNRLDGKKCTVCKYDGPVRFDTIRHIRNIHLKIKVFECNGCDFKNSKLSLLREHFKTNHLNKIEMPSPTNENTFDKKNQTDSISIEDDIQLEKHTPEMKKINEKFDVINSNKSGHNQNVEFIEKEVEMFENKKEKEHDKENHNEDVIKNDRESDNENNKKNYNNEIKNDTKTEEEIDLSQMIEEINIFADMKKYTMDQARSNVAGAAISQSDTQNAVDENKKQEIIQIQDQIVEKNTNISELEHKLDHPVEEIISVNDKGEIIFKNEEKKMNQIQDQMVINHVDNKENLLGNEFEEVGRREIISTMDVKNKNLVRKNSQKRNHKIYGTTHNATTSDKIKGKQKIELEENMRRILEEVREYIDQENLCESFLKLPNQKQLPDYYKVIPSYLCMDLSKIWFKIEDGDYKNIKDLENDFNLLCQNARKYNRDDSLIFKESITLQSIFRNAEEIYFGRNANKSDEELCKHFGCDISAEIILKDVLKNSEKKIGQKRMIEEESSESIKSLSVKRIRVPNRKYL